MKSGIITNNKQHFASGLIYVDHGDGAIHLIQGNVKNMFVRFPMFLNKCYIIEA